MKKLFLGSLVCFCTAALVAATTAPSHPGWNANNEKLDTAITQWKAYNDVSNSRKYSVIDAFIVMKAINNGECDTFSKLCSKVDSTVDAETALTQSEKTDIKIMLKKQICICKQIFYSEVFQFTKANPSGYDIHVYLFWDKKSVNQTELYKGLVSLLLNVNYNANIVSRGIDRIIDLGVTADVTTQKTDLQKLNRKYSKNLLTDKANWQSIIAKIRTAIQTY